MGERKAAEAIIEIASQLKESVRALCDAYRARPPLIEREERAVREHDFPIILGLRDEYEALNEQVELEVARLRGLGHKLADWRLSLLQGGEAPEARVPATVSETIELLRELRSRLPEAEGGALAVKILDHLVKGIASDWEAFVADKARIDTLIERNHVVLATLVENYQKSYQFWYESVERCSSSYNERGQQSSGNRLSGFTARA
jgi:hypothetical protein